MTGITSSWDPLTLAFSNAVLESQYSEYVFTTAFSKMDTRFVYITVLINVLIPISLTLKGRWAYVNAVLINLAVTLGFHFMLKYKNWYRQHRTIVICFYRAWRVFNAVRGVSGADRDAPGVTLIGRITAMCLTFNFWCFGMPLSFKIHIIHHMMVLMYVLSRLEPVYCEFQSSWDPIIAAIVPEQFQASWGRLFCRRLVLLMMFVIGYAMPTAIIWTIERRSRMHFLTERGVRLQGAVGSGYMIKLLACAIVCILCLVIVVM